jgi:hypothetical protein
MSLVDHVKRNRGRIGLVAAACVALASARCSATDMAGDARDAGAAGQASCEAGPSGASPVTDGATPAAAALDPTLTSAVAMLEEGRRTFRFDTFGDEDFWGGALGLHQAILGAARGGVGPGVSPETALAVGLKIDLDALPPAVVDAIKAGTFDLKSPDSTLAALQLGAVVGVTGFFDASASKKLTSMGIQCALCHSTVDDALAPGIGHRLDGWANRDLDVGAIVSLSPDLSGVAALLGVPEDAVRTVVKSWGPGKFDAQLFLDGKFALPGGSGKSSATMIPPAFGLAGVNLGTSTGFGSVTYWNAFVANLEMHGKGTFFDPRLDDAARFPVAARARSGHVTSTDDRITPTLAALQVYQLALRAPSPPPTSYDAGLAAKGKSVFEGAGRCASCHVPPLFTEPGWNMHTADEIGIDAFQSSRSPEARYRTSPLRGLFSHAKGGFYHDGRYATVADVVRHYDTDLRLGLTDAEEAALVEYVKSL